MPQQHILIGFQNNDSDQRSSAKVSAIDDKRELKTENDPLPLA